MRRSNWRLPLTVVAVLLLLLPTTTQAARYNNTLFGYSFEYPSWWQIDLTSIPDGVRISLPNFELVLMEMRVSQNTEGLSLDELLEPLLKSLEIDPASLAVRPMLALPMPGPEQPPDTESASFASPPNLSKGRPPVIWWMTLDGVDARRIDLRDQLNLVCLHDGYVYELIVKGPLRMWDTYFGPFFDSFRFQPRLAR